MNLSQQEIAGLPLGRRLLARTLFLLSRPWLLWALAVVFGGRDLFYASLEPAHPDTGSFWAGARALLSTPGTLYGPASEFIARHHVNPPAGSLLGFISPPTVAGLFVPLSPLSKPAAVHLWVALDAVMLAAAILVLQRALGARGSQAAVLWLVAVFFPPVFAELDAGQVGGPILLLASGSIALMVARPVAAGALTGVAAALKFYPALLALAVPAAARLRYWAALLAAGLGLLAASFVPVGLGGIVPYVRGVLLPTSAAATPDCAVVSTATLVSRYAGGARWFYLSGPGVASARLPWGSGPAAAVLTAIAVLLLVALALWAIYRSGGAVDFSAGIAFALGALVPAHVYPYQMLALLPLLLVLAVHAVARRDWALVPWLALTLALFVEPPCAIAVPNLWTAGGLVLFGLAVHEAPRFRPAVP